LKYVIGGADGEFKRKPTDHAALYRAGEKRVIARA
jgi:hypothetical protein